MDELINVHKKIENLNYLFDQYLKPLKNKNARLILYLMDNLNKNYFTTHDIQTLLNKYNLNLDKKEINGILTSMSNHGLILKGVERGKPTTIEYSNKYTFEKWEITSKGKIIIQNLLKILDENYLENQKRFGKFNLNDFNELEKTYYLIKILKLFENKNQLQSNIICKKLSIKLEFLNSILIYINIKESDKFFEKIIINRGIKKTFYSFIGINYKEEIIQLTDYGKQIAKNMNTK